MIFRQLFDPTSSTYTYLLGDAETREAVIIDPVLEQKDRDLLLLEELGLTLKFTLDTHVHADHITASGTLRVATGATSVASAIAGVGCVDRGVEPGDKVRFGSLELEVRATPGHTRGCVSYVLHRDHETLCFCGDALLIRGCGRTDFQQGDPNMLFDSVREQIFTLPDDTMIYPGHDYRGRTCSTVREEKQHNPRLKLSIDKPAFVEIMGSLNLADPKLMHVAVPANLGCGMPATVEASEGGSPQGADDPDRPSASNAISSVRPEDLEDLSAYRVVDVRQPEEFDGPLGHLKTAELVPLAQVTQRAADWARDEALLLVCRSGGRSGKACTALAAMGFERLINLDGGMTLWRAQKGDADE